MLLASGPDDTSLEIISVPDGASVQLGGRALSGATPLTVEDLEAGQTVTLQVSHPGYEPSQAQIPLVEGVNRRVFLLNQIRATLHIETSPPGAQVWVDNVLRGSSPLPGKPRGLLSR